MTCDGENRLVKLERPAWTQPTGGFMAPANALGIPPNELPAATIEFKYDGLSRLIERRVTRGVDPPEVEGYQWDGWKLIMIAKLNTDGTFHSRKWSCVWRPDVGSSLYARSDWMRAGGVGGVAWLQTGTVQNYSYGTGSSEAHVPLADHMGNVRHYYQFRASGKTVTGQLVASYEYDAFGREVRAWGLNTPATNQSPGLPANRPWADLLPFHYSSKLRDVDSGFNYYGYRFYDPGAGRWLNRDPIGEEGGFNMLSYCKNSSLVMFDYLGREPRQLDVFASDVKLTGTDKLDLIKNAWGKVLGKQTTFKNQKQLADKLAEIINKEKEKGECCIRSLTINSHGSLNYGGIIFSNGSNDENDAEFLNQDVHGEQLGKLLKPHMCKPCQINLAGCAALGDDSWDNVNVGKVDGANGRGFARKLAQSSGCSVLGNSIGVNVVGADNEARWGNTKQQDLIQIDPNGTERSLLNSGRLGTINPASAAGIAPWPNALPPIR